MLRVLEQFATSLKVIQNGTTRKLGYGFLFALHSNYGRMFGRFDTIHERDRQTPHDGIGRAYAQHRATKNSAKMLVTVSPPRELLCIEGSIFDQYLALSQRQQATTYGYITVNRFIKLELVKYKNRI